MFSLCNNYLKDNIGAKNFINEMDNALMTGVNITRRIYMYLYASVKNEPHFSLTRQKQSL